MQTWKWLTDKIAEVEADAMYYKGDMRPTATEAYSEAWDDFGVWPPDHAPTLTRPQFVVIEVQYDSHGYCAEYNVDTRSGSFTVAAD